jgi:hypothetical protein
MLETGGPMKHFRSTIRYSALLLLVLTLHIVAHGLVLPKFESASLQEQAVCTASLTDGDSAQAMDLGECKPPKHSFIDYSTVFSRNHFIPAYNPNISRLLWYESFQVMPAVYLEINVPPDSLA